ncbi:MAG: hypothetical protein RSD61_02685, partial [Ruthenibacterium sp.]
IPLMCLNEEIKSNTAKTKALQRKQVFLHQDMRKNRNKSWNLQKYCEKNTQKLLTAAHFRFIFTLVCYTNSESFARKYRVILTVAYSDLSCRSRNNRSTCQTPPCSEVVYD